MALENGNGELAQLLQVKRSYRKDLGELQAKFEAEKKELKGRYLEKIVDAVFGEPVSAPVVVEEKKQEIAAPALPPTPSKPRCPGCDAEIVDVGAKFCSNCAYPLEEEGKMGAETPVPSTGRIGKHRHR